MNFTKQCQYFSDLVVISKQMDAAITIAKNIVSINFQEPVVVTLELGKIFTNILEEFKTGYCKLEVDGEGVEEFTEINRIVASKTKSTVKIYLELYPSGCIYFDLLSYKKRWASTGKWNDKFYLLDEWKLYSNEESFSEEVKEFKKKADFIQGVFSALKEVCHYDSEKEKKSVFIGTSEKGSSILEITNAVEKLFLNRDIKELEKIIPAENFIQPIVKEKENNSFNAVKETAILRSSIFDFFKNRDQQRTAEELSFDLLANFRKFKDLYQQNYQVFVNGLSIEKIRLEAISEKMKFIEALSKNLADSTTKMFSLPIVAVIGQFFSNTPLTSNTKISITATASMLIIYILFQLYQLSMLTSSKEFIFNDFESKLGTFSGIEINSLKDILKKIDYYLLAVKGSLWIYLLVCIVVLWYMCLIEEVPSH